MRIGMILDIEFPPDPRVENEAIELIKGGHEVFLFCLKYGDEATNETINGIQVCRYASNKVTYKLSALAYTFPFYAKIIKSKIDCFLEEKKIDIIHIHDMQIASAVYKVNEKFCLPVILDLHENRPEIMKFYPHLQVFPGKQLINPNKWKQKEEEFVKKATKVVVVTNESKAELIERTKKNPNDVIVVPNTVRKEFYSNPYIDKTITNKYKDYFVLLYIGDTGLRRGLQTVISAIAILKEKIQQIKLVIVGKNITDTVLKQQVEELNLQKYVSFEGWQNEQLFPSYIATSAVCLSPLHKNKHHDTTYANKLFQYMSFAKPVLVSNAIAQKNLIENTSSGLVHIERDSDDFANKTLRLYNNKDLCKELGENGKRFIEEEFNWSKTSEKLIELYDNLKN